jgi:ACS family hexuronate transporter-like MFS transporter
MYYGGHLAKNPGGNYWRGVPAYNHRWFRDWGLTLAALAAAEGKPHEQWLLGNVQREMQFMVDWLPEYLKRERHFSMEMIGAFAWIPFLSAALGSMAGGAASGALIRRQWSGVAARKAIMGLSAAGMLAGIPAVLAGNAALALALICVVTFSYCAWASNILALPADIFPNEVVASVTGIAGTGAALGGMMFTLATGAAVDRFSYAPVFIAAGLMPVAAAAVAAWGVRRAESAAQ